MSSEDMGDIDSDWIKRGPGRRRLLRFDPTVSAGMVMQMVLLIFGAVLAYGTYTADKAKDRAEVAQIKIDADRQRETVKETLGDLKGDVKDIQHTLVGVNQTLAVLKARDDADRERKGFR